MATDYDLISRIYDPLSRIVFGRTLMRAQEALLPAVKIGSRILIVGGGTGEILEHLGALHIRGLGIHYLESSARMIAMAKKRDYAVHVVGFIHRSIEEYDTTLQFDVIITPFLFDNFTQPQAEANFHKLSSLLKLDGIWLYTDYHINNDSTWWQKLLLRTMYLFFRVVSGVETHSMPAVAPLFSREYQVVEQHSFWRGFITSIIYRRK